MSTGETDRAEKKSQRALAPKIFNNQVRLGIVQCCSDYVVVCDVTEEGYETLLDVSLENIFGPNKKQFCQTPSLCF